MKRKLSLFCMLALLLHITACAAGPETGSVPTEGKISFADYTDLPESAWYTEAVNWCLEKKLMDGISNRSFSPETPADRLTLVTALYRQAGSPVPESDPGFSDVPAGSSGYEAVAWAAGEGVVNGYTDGRFGGADPVTREQFAAILWRRTGSPAPREGEPFTDQSAISSYALQAVTWAKGEGIVNGKGEGRFDPRGQITRGEVAAMLQRWLTAVPAGSGPASQSGGRVLVAYFSCTNNTEKIARHIQAVLGDRADLYEIVPAQPYTSADLNYNTDCRANREQNDDSARPAVSGTVEDMERYDVVFLGYPIWWGRAPKIIYTFLESYSWEGKTIVPFCTSGSSGYSDSGIKELVGDGTNWLSGRRFSGGGSQSAVAEWVEGLELPQPEKEGEAVFYISVNGHTLTADFADNSSAAAFRELLGQGPVTISMDDYGGFEKVGALGTTLPRNDSQITTQPGDVILYQGSSVTIYYDNNSWSFTRLGKIRDLTQAQLKEVLGAGRGEVGITFSLETAQAVSLPYDGGYPQHVPYGKGIGAMPGRVVWAHDPRSVDWDGEGYWWELEHFDERAVQAMVDAGIASLGGKETAGEGWKALFEANRVDRGLSGDYTAGQKIAIKANINGSGVMDDDTSGQTKMSYTNPVLLKALLVSLVEDAGAAPEDITVYDVSRLFPDYMVELCTAGGLAGVRFVGRNNGVADESASIRWSQAFSGRVNALPTCVTEAEYVINLANLKGHSYGVTLCGKNHFGSFINGNRMRPPEGADLHQWLTRNEMGIYSPLVDLMANADLGGKTVLYMLDALICAPSEGASITGDNSRWRQAPFNGHYTASLFVSQDPVAIDSVGADFLMNEPTVTSRNGALRDNATVENYLHEAGLVSHSPSGTTYTDGQGHVVTNLGVHEHWNNSVQKQYSRDLGRDEGIELVRLDTGAEEE